MAHSHSLGNLRRGVLASIRRQLEPVARPCGYRDLQTKTSLRIVCRMGPSGTDREIRIPQARLVEAQCFSAISTDGLVDAQGGGCYVTPWSAVPVEDLVHIDRYLTRALAKGQLR